LNRDSTSASSTATDPSSSSPSVASRSSPFNHDEQVPQSSSQALFWCTQCPNRQPFRVQSHLT
jgi:hypothetical protein